MVSVESLALLAAFLYACGKIAVKRATRAEGLLLGLLVSLVTGTTVVGVLTLLTVDEWSVAPHVVLLFMMAGVMGPGLGRVLSMMAVRDGGTSVASPLQSSANPLLASLAGIVILGETVGLGQGLALGLIVAGIWSCARGGSANRDLGPRLGQRPPPTRLLVLMLPLSAGAAHAGGDVFRKLALMDHGDPVLGAFIGLCTALAIWGVVFLVVVRRGAVGRLHRLHWLFCLAGVTGAAAQITLMFALRTGDLSVVAPIVAAQPVIVALLGALLLRDLERLRPGTVLGAVLVFLGVAYLSLG